MGIFDNIVGGTLKGILGQVEAAAVPALISAALAKTNLGNLQGILQQLQQGGLNSPSAAIRWSNWPRISAFRSMRP